MWIYVIIIFDISAGFFGFESKNELDLCTFDSYARKIQLGGDLVYRSVSPHRAIQNRLDVYRLAPTSTPSPLFIRYLNISYPHQHPHFYNHGKPTPAI